MISRINVTVAHRRTDYLAGKEAALFVRVWAGTEIYVVGTERYPSKLCICISIFNSCATANKNASFLPFQTCCRCCERLGPRRFAQYAIFTNQRSRNSILCHCVLECPTTFIAIPLFIYLWIISCQAAKCFISSDICTHRTSRCAVLANRRC